MRNLEFKRMSANEFMRWEAEQEERYELVDGEVFARTGGTYAHDRVRMNLSAVLLPHLRGTPCRLIGPEVKLRVEPGAPGYYPDLFVACREIEPGASEVDEAKLIIEVLSPSTEKKDRGGKWIEYQKLATLQEYALIDPDKRRIEIFRRMGAMDWRLHICSQTEPVRFESVEFATTFEVLFEDLVSPERGMQRGRRLASRNVMRAAESEFPSFSKASITRHHDSRWLSLISPRYSTWRCTTRAPAHRSDPRLIA